MAIVFRDHTLSDLIGFTYRSWDRARRRRGPCLQAAGAPADAYSRQSTRSRRPRWRERLGVLLQ